jgi:hypothetical protein
MLRKEKKQQETGKRISDSDPEKERLHEEDPEEGRRLREEETEESE